MQKIKQFSSKVFQAQPGAFNVGTIVAVAVGVAILGAIVPALWPTITGSDTAIQALTQTDAGTTTMQALWPILLIAVGCGIAAGLVMWALRKFNLSR